MRLDVERLVKDLGGPSAVAAMTGKPRTAPYRWMKTRYVNSQVLERIKNARPEMNLDDYFIEEDSEASNGARS